MLRTAGVFLAVSNDIAHTFVPQTLPTMTSPRTLTTTAFFAFGLAASALAQSAPSPTAPSTPAAEDPIKLEAFTVTGSNIRRIDTETTLPVTVMDRDDLDLRLAATPAELFQMLPNGGALTLTETNVLGADARGDNTSLNLRGIGSGNTLVLVNGRRLAPHPISQAEGGVPSLAVNINQLPAAAIQRVEVLRDGASAIYGADATAGVVNSILRRDYNGYDLSFRGGLTEHGGADDWRVTLSGGQNFNGGKTNVMAMIDVYHRSLLGTIDRKFTRDSDVRRVRDVPEPWNTTDTDFDNRSTSSQYGNFIRGAFDSTGTFVGARPTSNAGISTSTTPSTALTTSTAGAFFMVPLAGGGTGTRQTTPSRLLTSVERDYYYNLNIDRVILPRTDRVNFFTAVDHKLSDRLSGFGELAYYRADSFNHRDPAGIDGTDDYNIYVGANNPYNPFGSRFYNPTGAPNADGTARVTGTPADVLIAGGTGVRPREFKAKDIKVLSQSLRLVGGLRGKTFGDFEWESAALYSRAWTRDDEANNVRHSRLQAALVRTDATAFNPFGYTFRNVGGVIQVDQPYTNPATVVDPLIENFIREGRTELASLDGKLNGTIAEVWGRRIGGALGAEYRWESYKDWRPPYAGLNPAGDTTPFLPVGNDNDFIGLSPNLNLYSERDVISTYAELLLPIFNKEHRLPLFNVLEFSLAGRYEKFSDFGDAFKPKYGVAWRPHANVLVRASYNESFRAPNLVQTNPQPLQRSVTGVSDPYRSEVTGLITDGSTNRTVFRQGNASLRPEEAKTSTIGIAIEVPRIKGLTITADWWRLDQNDVIDNLGASGVLLRDEILLDAYTQAQIAGGTNANSVNTNSGVAGYKGSDKVSRAPVTAADLTAYATFNSTRPASSQRAPVGRVLSVVDDYLNLAGRKLVGWDFAVSYRLPKFAIGQFTLKAEGTYNQKYLQQLDEFSEPDSILLEDGRAKWRGNGSVSWRRGAWSASWFAEYYGGSMDPGGALSTGATGQAQYEALGKPDYVYVFNDIGGVVRYRWWIKEVIQHSFNVQHRFTAKQGLLARVTAKFGVSNVFDEEPPIADESRGYQGGTVSAKGRSYYLEISKKL